VSQWLPVTSTWLVGGEADQIEDREPEPAEHGLEVLPDLPEREHVEQDVQGLAGGVHECRGQEAPRLRRTEDRHERELAGRLG